MIRVSYQLRTVKDITSSQETDQYSKIPTTFYDCSFYFFDVCLSHHIKIYFT